jgi:CelD/BcsL family acetyltransferase involved in cellulose biosynthesis
VFAAPQFARFHEIVMGGLLDAGSLDLLWLRARDEPIAAVYNVVWNRKVYFYQSGRRTDLPKGLRPGIVMHALAIRDAIERGMREYDFLSGTLRYKMDLALATHPLVHLRAARPSVLEAARRTAEIAIDHARALRDGLQRQWASM